MQHYVINWPAGHGTEHPLARFSLARNPPISQTVTKNHSMEQGMTTPIKFFHKPSHWLLLFGLWTIPPVLAGLALLAQAPPGMSSMQLLGMQLLVWYPWALLTPPIFLGAQRFPFHKGQILASLAIHIALGLTCGLLFQLYLLVSEALTYANISLSFAMVGQQLKANAANILIYSLFYWIVLAVANGIVFYRGSREREALLIHAQLQALKAQIHPHFLFNTLHAVSALMDDDVPGARRMIVRLSELLRASLSEKTDDQVSLHEELDLLNLYLDIERVRFADRLQILFQIDPQVEGALVPHLILQPLVENAIRHGISRDSTAGYLEIRAFRQDQSLIIHITDDGPGLNQTIQTTGIGLGNTRARLQTLYGGDARLELKNREPRGCRTIIQLPYGLTTGSP